MTGDGGARRRGYKLGFHKVSLSVQPRKAHSGRFCGTFQGIEPKDMTGDCVLCKNWYLLAETNFKPRHPHKTESWYLSGAFFTISDEHHHLIYMRV